MTSTANTVEVRNIALTTPDSEIKDFFSFCGKVTNIDVTGNAENKSATVTFEKETAMKTALLLNNTQLGSSTITVSSLTGENEDDGAQQEIDRDADELTQEMKPRARILAEYLAHGYVIGDAAIERAIELDQKHQVTNKFVNTLQNLDQKYHATDRAKATDQSYGISVRGKNFLTGLNSYFEKATNTPTGKKLVNFYTASSKQVQDIHNEALRLAELKKEAHGGSAYKAAGLERVFGKEAEKKDSEKKTEEAHQASVPAPGTESPAAPEKTS
ncbi:hypothetical protein jhhlp_002678 [Lomentospora prolificans]|uniref:RRM domain-containing protein n=1 Tax=Lomentospora prolificans TaxID=41688 RepID=A0A2N3NEP5_9PEZI|nr:hypothetical protein jhhlp_002678 [Lomentospora prolificans]